MTCTSFPQEHAKEGLQFRNTHFSLVENTQEGVVSACTSRGSKHQIRDLYRILCRIHFWTPLTVNLWTGESGFPIHFPSTHLHTRFLSPKWASARRGMSKSPPRCGGCSPHMGMSKVRTLGVIHHLDKSLALTHSQIRRRSKLSDSVHAFCIWYTVHNHLRSAGTRGDCAAVWKDVPLAHRAGRGPTQHDTIKTKQSNQSTNNRPPKHKQKTFKPFRRLHGALAHPRRRSPSSAWAAGHSWETGSGK